MIQLLPLYETRPVRLDYLPTELYIETTNRCNLKCRTCPQHFGMPEDSADLSVEAVERILDQVPAVRRVVLHGIGEPLLNPKLPEVIRSVKARDAYALFNTNGLLLRGRVAAELVNSKLDELRISVDSASPETYKLIRGVDGLERIFSNLEAFSLIKQEAGATTPKVSLWITGMKVNVEELPDLVRRAAHIGVGEVYLQRLVFSDRGFARTEEALFRRAGDRQVDAIAEAVRVAEALGVRLAGSGEVTAENVLSADDEDVSYRECRRPWTLMYVTANGNVLPCCIAPFTSVPYGDIVLGNLFSQTVEEIWNGPRYLEWRRRMVGPNPPEACAGCGKDWSL
jgi:MoaA/NifB/PqqE/SkfB family radical SAM enzyme